MNIRTKHPELGLIIKAEVEGDTPPDLSKITFGLPTKASKLEKFLLKMVEIYSFDVLRNNMYDTLINSPEYKKYLTNLTRVARRAGNGQFSDMANPGIPGMVFCGETPKKHPPYDPIA